MQETNSEAVGFRLSAQQQQLLDGGMDSAFVQCATLVELDEQQLRTAIEAQVERHEILRTTFPRQVGVRGRSQVVHEQLAPDWTAVEGAPLQQLLASEAARPFDLGAGPLLRALTAPVDGGRVLVLTAHAACADLETLLSLAACDAGDEEPVQYADYAEWRHELISGDDEQAAEGRTFWQADRPPSPRLLFAGSAGSATLRAVPVELDAAEIEAAAAAAGVSVGQLLEASWHALIARLDGETEQLVASWCDGRAQPDLEGGIGPYAQPVPVQSRIEPETTFAEVIDQVARARAAAAAWQDFASAEQLAELTASAASGFAAHAESALALVPAAAGVPLLALVRTGPLAVEVWHDPARQPDVDAAEIATRWSVLLSAAAADPAQAVLRLPIVGDDERTQLIANASGPAPGEDAATPVHFLFERAASLHPTAPAVADGQRELTYEELNASANRIAHLLAAAGVKPGARVALCMERTTRLLEALVGILKAGAAYVPLNYEHPSARISHQLTEAGVRVIVTEEHLLERLPEQAGEVVCVDRDAERIAAQPSENPPACAGELAYVMYTSGSTGLPKGVAVTHANLANYSVQMAPRLGAGAGVRFGVVSAISTDLGNTCIFPALVAGGCVQLVSPDAAMDAGTMAGELGEKRLDVLKITPSHLRGLLAGEDAGTVLPRRTLALGGEALSWELVARLRELAPQCRLLNHYGPTEATIGCCAYEIGEPREDCVTVPVGYPLAGEQAHVLDAGLEPLPAGVPGELCVAGAGIAAGYVGQADGGPFIDDPFTTGRMYRTGDRARRLRDGAIEFLGRVDDQVKIRGFRIEPGEIESALARHPAVRQAAVVARRDDRGETRLVAYLASSADPSVEELQAFLATSLPDYMIPSAFATLPSLPFTPSGKVDRRALPDLADVQTRRGAEYVAPRDEVEQEIAGIWGELLGVEEVGVNDDFFALGGHSLLATQAIMRIRRIHGDIPLRALLAAPTVAALAEVVRSASK